VKDVRNTIRKGLRFSSARKGAKDKTSKQDKYYTWHLWGIDNQEVFHNEGEQAFAKLFDQAFEDRRLFNLEKYGTEKPWKKINSTYYLASQLPASQRV